MKTNIEDIEIKEDNIEKEVVKTKKKTTQKKETKENELDKIIESLKEKGYSLLYKNIIDSEPYIWRPLTRKEYRQINKLVEGKDENKTDLDILFDRQELILKYSVLYPENIEQKIEEKGGLATVLADEIMDMSGFQVSYTEKI